MVYFVTENFIKTRTQLSQNIDVADIIPNVRIAATEYARPILGKRFFDDLLTKYNNNTLSNDEKDLVDIVKMIVAFRATDLCLPFLSFNIKNKGVMSQSGEFSASEGLEVLNYIRNEVKKFAHIKENELKEFLKLNKNNYPLYTDKTNDEIVKPQNPEVSNRFDII